LEWEPNLVPRGTETRRRQGLIVCLLDKKPHFKAYIKHGVLVNLFVSTKLTRQNNFRRTNSLNLFTMRSIALSFRAQILLACLAILFSIVNSSPISFHIRHALKLITVAIFDKNGDIITEFEVGIALQQDFNVQYCGASSS
jgi:hypothetical protein